VKNFFKVLILTGGIVIFVNINSFALVDVAGWGGYTFNGTVENNSSADPKGVDYGVKAHINTSVILLFDLGLGAYYEGSKLKYGLNTDPAFNRKSAGLDVNLILSLPIIHPYARGTYAFWDKFENDIEKFKAYGLGAGVELTVFPFIRIFGEYMFENTEHYSSSLKTSTVNFGLKVDI